MSLQLLSALQKFHKSHTKAVIFKGAGSKAFCAGGDVKTQYLIKNNLMQDPLIKVIPDYHRQKFACDYRTAQMKPLQISIWDGYVMGGGVGVSAHSDFIVVTERAVFAMPEAKIGFFTDVGGGWVLGRMRGNIGKWLGLTGETLKGESIVKAGLAKFFVEKKDLGKLESELQSVFESFGEGEGELGDSALKQKISGVIGKYSQSRVTGKSIPNEDLIREVFGGSTYAQINSRIFARRRTSNGPDRIFLERTLGQLSKNSPLSMTVIIEQITRHLTVSLREAFRSDFRTAYAFTKSFDYFEGIRCALIDKGQTPNWEFNSHTQITQTVVESFFNQTPPGGELDI